MLLITVSIINVCSFPPESFFFVAELERLKLVAYNDLANQSGSNYRSTHLARLSSAVVLPSRDFEIN